jgi:hypothetical protein
MYGYHELPFEIEKDGIFISVKMEGEQLVYRRTCLDEITEKIILTQNGTLFINPVEPLIKPVDITPHFLIEFGKPVMVEPKSESKIYLKFPIEIGVFLNSHRSYDILDSITLMPQKFALYGDARNGLICKYWFSDVYGSMPSADILHEGVLELNINNTTSKWIEITKAVFNAYGMKIYYGKDRVSMRAHMRVLSEMIAETDFIDAPIKTGMEKSIEYYAARRMSVLTTKFVMELGL